jgi:hypothetical protein
MPESPTFLADRLLAEGQKSILFFKELKADDWHKTIYTDGAYWTPKQVLAHFLATEISLYMLLQNILSGGEGSPTDFDTNLYNQRKVARLENETVEKMINLFLENRSRTASLVRQLSEHELEIQGRHPFLGVAPLTEIIKIIYRHNQIHQREIRTILKSSTRGDS